MDIKIKVGQTLIGINVICEVPFYNKKLGIMTLTSLLKYDHEIKKMIIYVNVMLIYVNNIEKNFFYILICVNFMLIYANVTDRQTNISKV